MNNFLNSQLSSRPPCLSNFLLNFNTQGSVMNIEIRQISKGEKLTVLTISLDPLLWNVRNVKNLSDNPDHDNLDIFCMSAKMKNHRSNSLHL